MQKPTAMDLFTVNVGDQPARIQDGRAEGAPVGKIQFLDSDDDKRPSLTVNLHNQDEWLKIQDMLTKAVHLHQQALFGTASLTLEDVRGKMVCPLIKSPVEKRDQPGQFWSPQTKINIQTSKKHSGPTPVFHDVTIKCSDGHDVGFADLRSRAVIRFVVTLKVYVTKQRQWGFSKYLRSMEVPAGNDHLVAPSAFYQ